MLLSEMFGVERDVDFKVKGYVGYFMIREWSDGTERLWWRLKENKVYVNADLEVLYNVLLKIPGNIIHLPPPLTDEQREQLKALLTLGYRWIAKDSNGFVYLCGNSKPEKRRSCWVVECADMYRIREQMPESIVKSLVSWSDHEPYDIAKALGVEG